MKNDKDIPTNAPEIWLRQTLGGYRPEAPDDAWQRLAPHLPQRKRRRPLVFWLSWSAVGVLAALVLFYFLKSATPPIVPPAVVEVEQSLRQSLPAVLPELLEKKRLVTLAEEPIIMTDVSRPGNHSPRTSNPQSATRLPKDLTVSGTADADFLKRETDMTFDFSAKATAAAISSSEKNALPQTENPLETLSRKVPVPLHLAQNPLPEVQFPALPVLPKNAKPRRFWFGVEAAPALFMQKNMGEMSVGLVFPEMHHRPGNGWQAGVSLAVEPLKNWRIATGIQFFGQTHEAQHSATLRLMDGVCLNPHYAGLKEYEFRYAVVSGGEKSNFTLRLHQQDIGSTMPDDEPFTLDMKTVHRSTAWRVPLSVERQFGTGKWRGFVRGGAVVDFSENTKTEIAHFTEMCQDLCFQSDHVPAIQTASASKTEIGWLTGAGIERQISRRAALRFEPFMVGQKGSMQYGLNLGLLFSN